MLSCIREILGRKAMSRGYQTQKNEAPNVTPNTSQIQSDSTANASRTQSNTTKRIGEAMSSNIFFIPANIDLAQQSHNDAPLQNSKQTQQRKFLDAFKALFKAIDSNDLVKIKSLKESIDPEVMTDFLNRVDNKGNPAVIRLLEKYNIKPH